MPIRDRSTLPSQEDAESLALRALAFIASDDSLLGRFMSQSGLSIEEVKQRAAEPVFLGAVLDFMMEEEATLLAFCAEYSVKPEAFQQLRQKLPGAITYW